MKSFKYILLPLLTFGLFACGGNEESATETHTAAPIARKVETAKVEKIDHQETIFATGTLSSREEVKLSFKTGGVIQAIYVREGQNVQKGQVLAKLDLEEIQAQVQQADIGKDQANINVENAKLALQLAERDYKNAQGLYQDSVATLEQLQNAEVQLNNARNQLEAAKKGLAFSEQNVEVANFNLKYSTIVAPTSGTILKKLAEVNELVGTGTPVIYFGSKDKAQVIRVNITDKDIIHIDLEDRAEVQFDAYPQHKFEGIVREIASTADPYTNTYEVEIEVLPEGKKLLSGFIGRVNIFTDAGESLLRVPVDALYSANGQLGEVFIIHNGKASKTSISIIKMEGDYLLVNKGLTPDDEVIVSGVGYLEADQPVIISQNK